MRTLLRVLPPLAIGALILTHAGTTLADLVVTPVPAGTEGLTTDLFDVAQGASVTAATDPKFVGGVASDPSAALGATTGFVEPTHAIFTDDGGQAGDVDFLRFRTGGPIDLLAFDLYLHDDSGATPFGDRGATSITLLAGSDPGLLSVVSSGTLDENYQVSYGSDWIRVSDLLAGVTGVQFFELRLTRTTGFGTRIVEFDGFGRMVPEPSGLILTGLGAALLGLAWRRRAAREAA